MEILINNAVVAQEDEPNNADGFFGSLYLSLRSKERRIYTDEQLKELPDIDNAHPYYGEWKIRKQSADRLIQYLKKKKQALQILEIGCGNGWLANKLAAIEKTNVLAIDLNGIEIKQAKRVFKNSNVQFEQMSFNASTFKDRKFDIILFAASIQYFPSAKAILTEVGKCLTKDGEIHIVDTNFYDSISVGHAIERTKSYFKKMGFEQMSTNYFHHQLVDLKGFNFKILYHPKIFLNRILVKNPFYWICIKFKQ